MKRKVIRQSDCNTTAEVAKLFQQLFDKLSENDEHNDVIDEYNKVVFKENADA